jgi:CheY-like chemotaxis protein
MIFPFTQIQRRSLLQANAIPTRIFSKVSVAAFAVELSCGVIGRSTTRGCSFGSLRSYKSPARVFACLCTGACANLNCGTYVYKYNGTAKLSELGFDILKGGKLRKSSSRVLVVEDSEPFRKIICSTLGRRPELQIVGEASDGLEAVQKAEELQPDLILLDIGLPTLSGIEVARRIRELSPQSRVLFVSQDSSVHVVQAALAEGAKGYVVKMDSRRELLTGVDAVLRGEQFVGRRFSDHAFVRARDARVSEGDPRQ